MFRQYKIKDYNFKLILFLIALSTIGILAVGSARQDYMNRQLFGVCAGVGIMLIFSFFDYSLLLYLYWPIYFLNIALLLSVRYFGVDVNNAQRWVNLLGIQFQPSETAKILLILFYAQFIMKYREKINTLKFLVISLGLLIAPVYLIYDQPDLSTSIMIVIVFCVMLFVGGLSFKLIGGFLAFLVPMMVAFFVIILQPEQELIRGYQVNRILAWLEPDKYADTLAYQQLNSITAIGSGQLWGKGLNNNVITSVKNGNFVLEPQTDFIFAVIGEELGFAGATAVIVLVLLIVLECLLTARVAKDMAGSVIACAVAALVGFQSFLNISVATGLLPNTGIPLPFVSYGLTSLISLFMAMGIVLNIRLQARKY